MDKLQKSLKAFVTRQFMNFNKAAFLKNLKSVYWDDLLGVDEDPSILVQLWTKVFVGTLDKHAPLLKRKRKTTWVTQI